MLHTSQRTQIYLPKKLRGEIDKARREKGETLAEYLRRAAQLRLKKQKREKEDLAKLADQITKGVKKSGWDGIDVVEWQRKIREDRDINVHS